MTMSLETVDSLYEAMCATGYFSDRSLATAVFLSIKLGRPLLLEGSPGVGKTELAKTVAWVLKRPLIRLQCYDGIDQREALYEWNYPAQLLHMRGADGVPGHPDRRESEIYQDRYLIERPLLKALRAPAPGAVLLIDEVDRADEPFESFLLEYLGEYQISIPEMGSLQAQVPPVAILTSNQTRELHGAIKRRCLYHWLDYPEPERELAIIRSQVPQASEALTLQIVNFVARLRSESLSPALTRAPGIAEAIDWARALVALDAIYLYPEVVKATAGMLLKERGDLAWLSPSIAADLIAQE